MLRGKRILLGVCGSIAAYKAAYLTRLLVGEGAEVKIIMTASSRTFITPLTLATLSKNPVLTDFEKNDSGEWNNHVELGLWADLMVIAPASANTLAKMASGLCDNLLLATYLSAKCPVVIAPAMDLDMYAHPSTTSNINTLKSYGNEIIAAEFGELASGLVGNGRMAEPETIVTVISDTLKKKSPQNKPLQGKQVLITAGPTHEAIDPVRFIGNHSSGKMGFAIAQACADAGAHVTLVTGPTSLSIQNPSVHVIRVVNASDMYDAAASVFDHANIIILAAAVADYKPAKTAEQKIKKTEGSLSLELTKTVDIAAKLGAKKKEGQIIVGFALETENEKSNAAGKLKKKNFDLIVLNSLNDAGAGFGHDTNQITILDKHNHQQTFPLKSKTEVAHDILDAIIKFNV
ncbi:bifunctional phosphopantothenoylcysteine decarboxylase/phosphopantothenate--cysteine ligase CoaBC [Fulvivirga sedimenti]|uniref:Coenzyme A biosynthesis bifunctional protein CoaBC n=1 Tax=Fulvivirga sedimenti TaxID=2879465 RepID=A0A9X1HMV4_9BACT|nr:bifunctional phosphopantothenoylcysteine decarboxylase/phosphopantothenate--cysteine ligase CoaBC [Fulvivirga sedimenti]MCA6073915.1 bifunctional phosphopantothenoylcysteine decarboxylase/phosphopantothenate--cysteine ligase CoaBC [Fulvivirga sedimenti]